MIVPASMAGTINTAPDLAEAGDPTPIRHPPVMGEAARASPGPAGVLAYPRPRTLTAPARAGLCRIFSASESSPGRLPHLPTARPLRGRDVDKWRPCLFADQPGKG